MVSKDKDIAQRVQQEKINSINDPGFSNSIPCIKKCTILEEFFAVRLRNMNITSITYFKMMKIKALCMHPT